MIMDLVGHSATAVVAEAEAAMIAIPPSEELLGFALRDANDGCRVVRAGRHPLRLETSTLECGHLKCMYVYVAAFKCMCMRMRMRMCICMCIETSSLGCGHGARQHLVGARSMAELAAAARAPAEDLVRTSGVYVYVYVYVHVYVHVYLYAYVYLYLYAYVYVCVSSQSPS